MESLGLDLDFFEKGDLFRSFFAELIDCYDINLGESVAAFFSFDSSLSLLTLPI